MEFLFKFCTCSSDVSNKRKKVSPGQTEKFNNAKKREGKGLGSAGGRPSKLRKPNSGRKILQLGLVQARATLAVAARRLVEYAGHNLSLLKKAVGICK